MVSRQHVRLQRSKSANQWDLEYSAILTHCLVYAGTFVSISLFFPELN